jgi:hypothetical protein
MDHPSRRSFLGNSGAVLASLAYQNSGKALAWSMPRKVRPDEHIGSGAALRGDAQGICRTNRRPGCVNTGLLHVYLGLDGLSRLCQMLAHHGARTFRIAQLDRGIHTTVKAE